MPYPPPPPFPPGPHHPQYPFDPRMWYTDVEPAYEKPAECECHFPPIPDNCVCVTEEDANNWNYAYNIVSAVSAGIDVEAIASAAQLLTSADYWNQTHDVVSAGSAMWNSLPTVSGDLKTLAQSALWLAREISARGIRTDKSLSGKGTVEEPLGINEEKYDELYEHFYDLYKDLTSSFDVKAIWEAMSACKQNYDTAINELTGGHKQNYELILQLMGVIPNSGNYPMIWTEVSSMQSDKPNSYAGCNTTNWMYYSTYRQGQ